MTIFRRRHHPSRRWLLWTSSLLTTASRQTCCSLSPNVQTTRQLHTTIFKAFILRHGQTDANAQGTIQGSSDFSRLTQKGQQQAAQVLQAWQQHVDNESAATATTTIHSVYCSPLTRAQETWEILRDMAQQPQPQSPSTSSSSLQLPTTAKVLDNLREIDFYQWEGKTKSELVASDESSWKAWLEGDPSNLIVDDDDDGKKYPLLELWDRADQVWDEIFQHEYYAANQETNNDVLSTTTSTAINHEITTRCSLLVVHGSLGQALLGTAMGWDATRFRQHEFPNCGMVEVEWYFPSSDFLAFIIQDNDNADRSIRRPQATRWRWRWPNPSPQQWYTWDNGDGI